MRLVTVLVLSLAVAAQAQEPAPEKVSPKPVATVAEKAPVADQNQELTRTVAKLRAKLKELEAQLARATPPQILAPLAVKRAAGNAVVLDVKPQAAVRAVQVIARGAGGRIVFTTQAEPSPLVRGDYEKALGDLDDARGAMRTAEDIPEAMRALDRATKALMEARTALWKQRDEKAGKPAVPEPPTAAKPDQAKTPTPPEKSK